MVFFVKKEVLQALVTPKSEAGQQPFVPTIQESLE